MREPDYAEWLATLREKASRHSLLFLQLGAACEPARRALRGAGFGSITVTEYVANEDDAVAPIIVIDKVEQLIDLAVDVTMGELRERVFASIDHGTRFILLSRAPRIAFPAVPGSSLLDDATFVHGPRESVGRHTEWATCRLDDRDPEAVLLDVLRELGPALCASLDRVIFECLLIGGEALGVLTARELEALEGAGVISLEGAGSWSFPVHLNPLKEGLAAVLADQVQPQSQLAQVIGGLWKLERLIRRAIRARAVAAWGPRWRSQCLHGDLSKTVLSRATEDAYYAANSIKLIRDPLEWLTLGELLALKSRTEIGNLGLTTAQWRKFNEQIMPIRNRLAHMRTLHPGDAADVVMWLKVLEVKLSTI